MRPERKELKRLLSALQLIKNQVQYKKVLMKKMVIAILGVFFVLVLTLIGIVYLTRSSIPTQGGKECVIDSDCVVFGETGDCNCGCYNKNNLPTSSGGECFCAAPTSCRCTEGECQGIFEEETPPEEMSEDTCDGMSLEEAKEIAVGSECGGRLKDNYFCNSYTKTWWIDLAIEREGCYPACVIYTEKGEAEINWRCTGLIPKEE